MAMEQTVVKFIQEIIYFDIWEAFLFLLLFLVDNNIKISKIQGMFHIFMLAILDYIFSNINIPCLMQILYILSMIFYFSMVFRVKFFKSTVSTIKAFGMMFIIESIISGIYINTIHLQLLSISNSQKFIYMLPIRILEFVSVYMYYRYMKGGENTHEKNN